jgi:hypothetical protein
MRTCTADGLVYGSQHMLTCTADGLVKLCEVKAQLATAHLQVKVSKLYRDGRTNAVKSQ